MDNQQQRVENRGYRASPFILLYIVHYFVTTSPSFLQDQLFLAHFTWLGQAFTLKSQSQRGPTAARRIGKFCA